MFAIIKFVGVTPDALATLHKVAKSPVCMTENQVQVVNCNHSSCRNEPYFEIQDSKLSPEHGTYTVSVKASLLIACEDFVGKERHRKAKFNLFTPLKAFAAILQAVEPALAQDKEFLLPADEQSVTALEKAKLEDRQYEILEKLCADFEGKECPADLYKYSDSETPILQKRVLLTSYQMHELAKEIRWIDLESLPNNEFSKAMREAQKQIVALDEEIRS